MVLPIFTTHYSIGQSILTLEEAGRTKEGAAVSVCDLAKNHGLKHVIIVDDRIDGFIEAYKNVTKTGSQLIFGVKLTVCADMNDKTEASLDTESSVIIFIRSTEGYSDLVRIYNRAWTDGFYYRGRADWKLLKTFWTPNLVLGLPFFSSFIGRNATTMSTIVPDLPVSASEVWVLREIESGLPFSSFIENGIKKYVADTNAQVIDVKTIYYKNRADFKSYQVLRCISKRTSFGSPNIEHLASDQFSFEDYLKLTV